MKRISAILLLLAFALTIMVTPVFAETTEDFPGYSYVKAVELTIGDKEAWVNWSPTTMDQPAYIKGGRTLVPFRFLGEALGAQVQWDNATRTATLTLNSSEIKVTLGSKKAVVNGKEVTLDVAAESKGGRTFIPLRFVSEAFGAEVDYDAETKTISVNLVDTTGWKQYTEPVSGSKVKCPADWIVNTKETTYLEVYTPLESTLVFTSSEAGIKETATEIKDAMKEEGFELVSELPLDSANPNAGTLIEFMVEDEEEYDASVVTGCVVTKNSAGKTCVFSLSGSLLSYIDDWTVVEKIITTLE